MRTLTLLLLLASPAGAQSSDAIATTLRTICTASGGIFTTGPAFVTSMDVTGDDIADLVIDEAAATCSTSTAAAATEHRLHVVVGGVTQVFDATLWAVTTLRDTKTTLLILGHAGQECGAAADIPCFEALHWNGHSFTTLRMLE